MSNEKINKISSSTLFHFTRSFDFLTGILDNGFKPKLCLEEIKIKDKVYKIYIPMVSFCDILLSQAKDYMNDRYGCYGVGLPKKWGEKQGMNPVLYLRKDSKLAGCIDQILKNLFSLSKDPEMKKKTELDNITTDMVDIFRYLKPYSGEYKFYDEKEWRYVPESMSGYPFLLEEQYNTQKRKDLDDELKKQALTFDHAQIKYVIVEKSSDIPEITKVIKKKYRKTSDSDILCSKIITFRQMREDF